MLNFFKKFNFIIGITIVVLLYIPGWLIGELIVIGLGFLNNFLYSLSSPYPHWYIDFIYEGFGIHFLGRAAGIYFVIYFPIKKIEKYKKLNINWYPSIFILIGIIIFTIPAQLDKFADGYRGAIFIATSLGYILGGLTVPLYAFRYLRNHRN